jgi:hypothetical protein
MKITISTGNDDCETYTDIARHLRRLANRISDQGLDCLTKVIDRNGNTIGTVTTEEEG